MGYSTPDAYSQPDALGLTILGSLDDPESCYSFDDLMVWQHLDGRVFWATDSGCSCPSPVEMVTSLDDLTEITPETWAEFQQAVEGHCKYDPDSLAAERTELLAKVSALVPR